MAPRGPRYNALQAGEKYYVSDLPCPKGHVGKRVTKNWQCYECNLLLRAAHSRRHYVKVGYQSRPQPENTIYHHTRRWLLLPTRIAKYSKVLGCDGATLRMYIEGLWEPGMSWFNYGPSAIEWQLDHKIPLSKFNLEDPVQLSAATHYTNLQPLWRKDNLVKSYNIP